MKLNIIFLAIVTYLPFSTPAQAGNHCAATLETADKIVNMLDALSDKCEENLVAARAVMETGVEQAKECGCQLAEDTFSLAIEGSQSTKYSCGNITQGIRTIKSSVEDALYICYGG